MMVIERVFHWTYDENHPTSISLMVVIISNCKPRLIRGDC